MMAANYSAVRNRLKFYLDRVCNDDETLIVTRKDDRNVVVISLDRYNQMEKSIRNAEYLAKLAKADEQIKSGKVVIKTMEELEAMAE